MGGKEAYDERKRLRAENELLRERRENERLKDDLRSKSILEGLAALFSGNALVRISHQPGLMDIRLIPESE